MGVEGDVIRQGHGQQSSSSAGQRVRNIVALLGGGALRYRRYRLGELLLRLLLGLRHGGGGGGGGVVRAGVC